MDVLFLFSSHTSTRMLNTSMFRIVIKKSSFVGMRYIVLILLFMPLISVGQKIYSVDYQNQADVSVYVVEYENQCDLKVFKVDYPNQADGNKGLWHFVDYQNQADKKIFFVDYPNQSDLKIFFVKYQNQSGWRKKSKQHLMF